MKIKEVFGLIGAFLLGLLTLSIFKKESKPANEQKKENEEVISDSKKEDPKRDDAIAEAEAQLKANEEAIKKNEEILKKNKEVVKDAKKINTSST
jgi:hypothetical protein